MAEKAGRVVPEQVEVAMAVDVDQIRPVHARHPERIRTKIENGASVAAGEDICG
jgi:hypothetical protein